MLRLTMRTGEVDGVACGPRRPCSVRGAAEAPVAPVTVPVAFSAGPSARYDGGRLTAGLALAALLLALARRLVRATDWREPAEASTPGRPRRLIWRGAEKSLRRRSPGEATRSSVLMAVPIRPVRMNRFRTPARQQGQRAPAHR